MANATMNIGYARHLSEDEDYEAGAKMAQIFSGAMFAALSAYLIFSNSTRMSYIQRASLEKRLNVCCQINTIVASLSAFLNLFQITEVDNWVLPGQRQFTVDVARPIEWILTCPLMQLSLVLMGGSRIPEYRRVLMPAFAVAVLLAGSSTLFLDTPWVYILWGVGLCIHSVSMYFNRLQILEHSKGVEGLLTGDSEFRKATLILMGTWFPFPIWYMLSPEGIKLVEDVTVVQMGWACLNITAKFTLTFYIQRIKDNYCNRLKVTREMKGASAFAAGARGISDDENDEDGQAKYELQGDLRACVMETMTFLGMAENVERFLRLLQQANISSLAQIAQLNQKDCETLQLPFDLVTAVQKRHKVWALEMVDNAEKELEAGERHYEAANPKAKLTNKGKSKQDLTDQLEPVVTSPMSQQLGAIQVHEFDGNQQLPFAPSQNGYVNVDLMNNKVSPLGQPNSAAHWSSNANPFATSGAGNAFSSWPAGGPFNAYGNENTAITNFEKQDQTPRSMMEQQAQQKLFESLEQKLERVIETVGRRIERSEETVEMRVKQVEEKLGDGMQDINKALERMQKMFEGKMDCFKTTQAQQQYESTARSASPARSRGGSNPNIMVSSNYELQSWQAPTMGDLGQGPGLEHLFRQQREYTQSDMKMLMQQLADQLAKRTDEGKTNQFNQFQRQESPGNEMMLQMKLTSMEEMQSKRHTDLEQMQSRRQSELEENICRKIQQIMNTAVQNFSNVASQQTQSSLDRFSTKVEYSRQDNIEQIVEQNLMRITSNMEKLSATIEYSATANGKLEHNLMQMTKDLNEESEKNISMGIGVVGNTLRMLLEKMQDQQKGMHSENEKAFMSVIEKLHEQAQKDAERMKTMGSAIEDHYNRQVAELQGWQKALGEKDVAKMRAVASTIEECADKATKCQLEDLREFQKNLAQKEAEKMKLIANTIEEYNTNATNRQLEDLNNFQKRIEAVMKEQVEHQKKTNHVLVSALGGSQNPLAGSSEGLYRDSSRSDFSKPNKFSGSRATGW